MKKQYFGKDKMNELNAIYVVAFTNDDDVTRFTHIMSDEYGYENYTDVPEMFVDDDNNFTWAIAYDIDDGNDKKEFEQAYKEVKKALRKKGVD